MDNLAHTLAGAALGEAGLARATRLAMPALMIAANLPDVDVLAIPFGESLTFRRGWTHGWLAMLVLPPLLAATLLLWDRWRGRREAGRTPVRAGPLLLLCYVGTLSHPLLDWLNNYGVRLLMPTSGRWFYGDSIFIVDPWIWLTLGLGVWWSRRLTRRRPGAARPAVRPARAALAAVAAYVALMIVGSRAARAAAVAHLHAETGETPERVMAGPVPVNPLRRTVIYDLGDRYRFGEAAWTPGLVVRLEPEVLPVGRDAPAARAALAREEVRDFLTWSRFPVFRVGAAAGGSVPVQVSDVRYGRDGGGWASVTVRVARGAPAETPASEPTSAPPARRLPRSVSRH